MDKHILPPHNTFTIVLRCPACGAKLHPPTRHSCGQAASTLYQAGTALPSALLQDLSEIAEYLREEGDGRIVSASARLGMVA